MSSDQNVEYLKSITPFNELSEDRLQAISEYLQMLSFPAHKTIFEEGQEGDSFYIIKQGAVRIYVKEPETNDPVVLSVLSQGDYFGEMALITGEPRSASVETIEESNLLRLDKIGFEKLIHENPAISLSLSHMLSQRLQKANIQRLESEKLHHAKISPSGSLAEVPFNDVMRFCEQNSLTGILKLDNKAKHAEISFLKGNVQEVTMQDLKDAEAIDVIMQWKDGTFIVEPAFFSIEEDISLPHEVPGVKDGEGNPIEGLLNSALKKLVSIVGSAVLKDLIEDTINHLEPFFPTLKTYTFRIIPEVKSELNITEDWNDKQTLAVAVFLQTLFENCNAHVFGMSFLDVIDLSGTSKDQLKKISFFQYMDHAKEFAV